MVRLIATLPFLLMLLAASPAAAQERGWFPREQGECGWVYGRYGIYNGSGIARIWVIGTTHMLNLRDEDTSAPSVMYPATGGWDPMRDVIYGEFYTCALKRHIEGEMQQVRVTRIRNYIIREPL